MLIDNRAVSWACLVPSAVGIRSAGLPAEILNLLSDRLDPVGEAWVGWQPSRHTLPSLAQFRTAVLFKPKDISIAWLRNQGFAHIRTFAVVPSIEDARWFIASHSKQAAFRAWDLYTPFRGRARLQRAVMRMLTRVGAIGSIGDSLILAQRDRSPLETLLMNILHVSELSISIASGTPSPRRKLTMQLADAKGSVLAYAKYSNRSSIGALIRQEAQAVEHVRQLALKKAVVPALYHHGPIDDGYLMVSAPVNRQAVPSKLYLTPQHMAVLHELAGHRGLTWALGLLRQLEEKITAVKGVISSAWGERLEHAISAMATAPGFGSLPTALSHGDFAPWNIRVDSATGRLILFDWEQGQTDQFLLWDLFHFKTQVDILVRRCDATTSVQTSIAEVQSSPLPSALGVSPMQVAALYVAYLTDSCIRWFEDNVALHPASNQADPDQEKRGQMLDLAVQALRVMIDTPLEYSAFHILAPEGVGGIKKVDRLP